MAYLRMHESKFWGWVVASLIIGLGVGMISMFFVGQASANRKIEAAKKELTNQVAEANAKAASLETKLASSESSVSTLTEANSQLTAQLEKAKEDADDSSSSDSSATLTVVSREIQPDELDGGDTMTMTAKVKGSPEKVTMRIKAKSGSYDETFTLKKTSSSGSTQTWRATAEAPSKSGDYTYFATAIDGDTEVTMPGASPSTLTVQ